MKNWKKQSAILSKERRKVPSVPAAILAESKRTLYANPKPVVDPRWMAHIPIRKEL